MRLATRRIPQLPPLVIDTIIALGLFALGLEYRSRTADLVADVYTRVPDEFNLALIALMTLPLALRRRFPQIVLATVMGAFVLDRIFDYPGNIAAAALVLAMHSIGSELEPRRSLLLGGGLTVFIGVFTAVGAIQLESVGWSDFISTVLLLGVPLVLGREVYQRRRRIEALEDRARAAEREREERARQAVYDERTRIARELHDVVAHQMAVIALQAEGARRLLGETDSRIAESLDTIRQTSHDALTEMRHMVGLLRSDTSGQVGCLEPQPGMADLDHLVDQMRESGLVVSLGRHGPERPLGEGVDLNAFRIVQESLTNALKHGGSGARATVDVTYHADRVDLEVTDDGAGVGVSTDEDSDGARYDRAGHGLVGMRERVAMLGGELTAARLPSGGFRVRVTLPVD